MDKIKTYVVDIDNTICTQTYGDYSKAKPYQDRINKINDLYDAGHKIIYFTLCPASYRSFILLILS